MSKKKLENLEEALTVSQNLNVNTPHTHAYIAGLLNEIHRYQDGDEDLENTVEQAVLDTVSIIEFFETRLTVLENGKPTSEW
ncbi:hypothetical protein [Bifidobacterium sp. ESL0745]|uniref:hypothetical protein n=1 Tax=Bifidobacterium sp. ESL0745 TaxID=2983226 RepID=UPI0023F9967C|nr:hypothetical protein [Bifidobacterium sp. ESL0745]MDF7666249.1 hypothetical protein [Bifidobacterium sp. ESL0745]